MFNLSICNIFVGKYAGSVHVLFTDGRWMMHWTDGLIASNDVLQWVVR